MKMTEIIELDTRTFLAHYIPTQNRIEISQYLKDFPELGNFVLEHEKKHAKLKPYSFRHLWIDLKDRTKLFTSPKLLNQWAKFRKPTQPKDLKTRLFMILYDFMAVVQAFQMLLVIPTLLRSSKKWETFKLWLSEWWRTLLT